jgi:hypothetical protein
MDAPTLTLTFAVGIGATTAVFGVMRTVLLRPLPVDRPERVLLLGEQSPTSDARTVSPITFNNWEQRQSPFSELTAFRGSP